MRPEYARYVYFVQSGDDGPIKIGKSTSPYSRVAEMQTGNPCLLKLLAIVSGWTDEEHALHLRFSSLRLHPDAPLRRSGGSQGRQRLPSEWFRPEKSLVDFIASLKRAA